MANPERDSDTAYVELHSLSAGHSDTINCLAFSPDGVHLASGGDDYALIIWNALKGRLLYRLLFNASVGCVLWHPIHPETVIAGCDNGYLFQLHDFNLRTSQQHEIHLGVRSNIICLDYDVNHNYLAVGLGNEVHLTREVERNRYNGDKTLPPPSGSQEPSGDADSRLRPVSVHFLNNGDSLIVSYLRHGIVCWSTNTDAELWRIALPADTPEIGGSALSPDGRNLVVYNMVSGVARYAIGPKGSRSKPRQFYKLEKPARSKLRLHTSFLHDGRAIVCGTTTGQVCIWNVKTGEHFQLLTHAGDVVQAVATTQRRDTSFIATGSADKGQETYIKIWRAKISEYGQIHRSLAVDISCPERARTNPALEESVVRFVQALTVCPFACLLIL
ncbi:WD40 repeat-like protein [Trametes sanguinea]|nr:WD40 repeat-like protein [Trametes sanguinea]